MDYPVSPDDAEKLDRLDDLLDTVGEPGADVAAEALARSLDDAELRAATLVGLAVGLASVQLWQRAEDVALSLEGRRRSWALGLVVLYLAGSAQWDHAERLTALIPHPWDRIHALLTLAPGLIAAGLVERGLGLVSDAETRLPLLGRPGDRARFSSWIAHARASAGRLDPAGVEAVARSLDDLDPDERSGSLSSLARALADGRQWRMAEDLARSLGAVSAAIDLGHLAGKLADAGEWSEADRVAGLVEAPDEKAAALTHMAGRLLAAGRTERGLELLDEVERLAASSDDPELFAWTLYEAARTLAEAGRFDRAAAVAASNPCAEDRGRALHAIAVARLARGETQPALASLREAEGVLLGAEERARYQAFDVLLDVASAFVAAGKPDDARRAWAEAIEVARAGQAEGDFEGSKSLAWITRHLVSAGELELARDVALSIAEPSFRRKALIRVERAIRGRSRAGGDPPS
jgi:tetratricopeptide (TPR) repeat protein